jgi:hypothetical protein
MERGLKLISFMEKRWGINLGSDDEKLYLLNLEFVLEKENLVNKVSDSSLKDKIKKG